MPTRKVGTPEGDVGQHRAKGPDLVEVVNYGKTDSTTLGSETLTGYTGLSVVE